MRVMGGMHERSTGHFAHGVGEILSRCVQHDAFGKISRAHKTPQLDPKRIEDIVLARAQARDSQGHDMARQAAISRRTAVSVAAMTTIRARPEREASGLFTAIPHECLD